jgi:beta-phosphoglucomutase-like phosphatase (HAD superfamily)
VDIGEGIVETVVTAEDVKKTMPSPEAHRFALGELGLTADNALAVSGSASGLRAANTAGLATVVITGEGVPDIPAAVEVRPDFGGSAPLRVTDCQRMHSRWWATHKSSAA